MFFQNMSQGLFSIFLRCPGVSKDKSCWFWGLVTGSKTKKSWKLEFRAFKIMKSAFYCTNLKQINSRKLLNSLFKYISTINGQRMPIMIPICFPMILLWFFWEAHPRRPPRPSNLVSAGVVGGRPHIPATIVCHPLASPYFIFDRNLLDSQ